MSQLLTEASVSKLKPNPLKRLEIHDQVVSGLRLRISPSGKKSWSLMYKVAGEAIDGKRGANRRFTIGQYPLIDLKSARQKANDAKELADNGIDPIEHKRQEVLGLNERRFDKVLDRFIALHAKPNTKNWQDTDRLLKTVAVQAWGSKDISDIDRASVHALIDRTSEERGVAYARELRKHLSILFNWSADRGLCPYSPMAGMKRVDLKYKSRERVLSLDELRKIWDAAEKIGYPFGPIIKLLILSGQRRSEIASMQRDWFEIKNLEIPASEYKTGKPHLVPLTEAMTSIIEELPIWNGGTYVFSTTNGRSPSSGFSKIKRKIDDISEVSNWTFHDIRRSVATHMAKEGVIQEHIERVLGHTITGVAGTYNRYSYLDEKRRALEVWQKSLGT